jgi:5-methylcytosine-specific restriction endonuclease McrA
LISNLKRKKMETKEIIKNHPYLKQVDVDLGPQWNLFQTTLEKFIVRGTTFVINHQRQRKYLFQDRPGGTGDIWQRNIFVSLLMGIPFPQFEVNVDGNLVWIEDGQQRYRTFQAILNDMVKLPKDLSMLGEEYTQHQNKVFSELSGDIRQKIFNTQILLLNGIDLTQEELHKRFLLINNGTPLSAQDKRSAELSLGAGYIQGIVDGVPEDGQRLQDISPTKTMFKLGNGEYLKVNVPIKGRQLEEVVAHWYNTLHQGEKFQISQGQLNSLYKDFRESGEVKYQKQFEKILNEVDKCICNYPKPKDIKGRTLLLFWFVVKHYLDNGYKVDSSNLFTNYVRVLAKLKTEDPTITYKKMSGEEETLDFKRLIRICSDMAQIPTIINMVLEKLFEIADPIQLDARRVFTREEKIAKLDEQGGECGYCGVELKLEEGVGDHKVPHSHGGETSMDNLVVSCKKCNEMKSNLPYHLWEKLIPELKDSHKKLVNSEEV